MNLELAERILTSDESYWVFLKETEIKQKIVARSIIMFLIPDKINVSKNVNDITLNDIKELIDTSINNNIFISDAFAPFQLGQKIKRMIDGYPITCNKKQFLTEALNLGSKDIWEYKLLIDKINKENR